MPIFRALHGVFEFPRRHLFAFGRVEAQRIKMLLAFGRAADRIAFLERAMQIGGCKTAHIMHGHAFIFIFHEMIGEVLPAATLVTNKDHCLSPSAFIKSRRIMTIETQASRKIRWSGSDKCSIPSSTDQASVSRSRARLERPSVLSTFANAT